MRFRRTSALSQVPTLVPEPTVEVSVPEHPRLDDLYEYYDPERDPNPLPQRQQQRPTPLSQRRPQSSESSGAPSLRRTPRFVEQRVPATRSPPRARRSQSLSGTPPVRFDESGSTTPSVFQRLVSSNDYRPRRTLHTSRHTHDAILFALEAIRRGNGAQAQPLTADPLEEEARMSDLVRGAVPGTAATSGRSHNGGATRAAPATATPTEPPRYRTPTDVMRERRAREARKAEEAAARLRQEEEIRGLQAQQAVGVGDDPARRSGARVAGQPTQTYNIGGPQPTASSSRRQENIPPTQAATSRITSRAPQALPGDTRLSANTQRNRTEAYEQLNVPAPAKPVDSRATQQQQQQQQRAQLAPQPTQQPGAQNTGTAARSRFPNAFERWEDLSAQWEGIVSSFIHRMEENANELAGKPIDRQMARQIDDLSRAGANLFHAVVELQRLRASSERKFQRWFFETRHEQEQAQERQAQLENQVSTERQARTVEREARTVSSTSIEQVRAEKSKAEELVREMRRELLISKEEARRAWEELGRREQEERERTIALRSGEPTLIGGVQVVPMQGLPSRQGTVQRPQTRDGPTAGAGPTTMSGQQSAQRPGSRQTTTTSLDSPGEESRQFNYRAETGASPTVTDPFTESTRQQTQLRREPDTQFYSTPPRPTQPATSGAAMAAARAATSGSSPARTTDRAQYYQSATASTNAQMSGALPTPARQGTAETNTSYFPSNASVAPSEEEYHINDDGSYTRDLQGRRIPYRQALAAGPAAIPEQDQASGDEGEISEELSEDDDDHAADAERERMYAAQYRQTGQQALPPTTNGTTPRTTTGALPPMPPIPQGLVYEGQNYEQDPSIPTPPAVTQAMTGWETLQTRTHRHPTRLSDILEEQTARTSPSRTSYISTGPVAVGTAAPEPTEPTPRIRAVQRGPEAEEIEVPGSSRRRPR